MATPPKWATTLIAKGCDVFEVEQVPRLVWQRRKRASRTWGYVHYFDTDIYIGAGTNFLEQKLTLCHEFAHTLVGAHKGHSAAFWDKAWEVYRWAKLPIRYTLESETAYRIGARLAYYRRIDGQGK